MRGNLAGCMRPRQRLDAGRQREGGLGLKRAPSRPNRKKKSSDALHYE